MKAVKPASWFQLSFGILFLAAGTLNLASALYANGALMIGLGTIFIFLEML